MAQLFLVDKFSLAGLQLLHTAVLQMAYGARDKAIDDVNLGARQACGLRMTAGQFALVLEQQVAHTGTGTTPMVATSRRGGRGEAVVAGVVVDVVVLALAFHV